MPRCSPDSRQIALVADRDGETRSGTSMNGLFAVASLAVFSRTLCAKRLSPSLACSILGCASAKPAGRGA